MNTQTLATVSDAFAKQITSVKCLIRESQSGERFLDGTLGRCPVICFSFDVKLRSERCLLVGHTGRELKISWCSSDIASISTFADTLNEEDLQIRTEFGNSRAVGLMDCTPLIMPLDPVANVPIAMNRLAAVGRGGIDGPTGIFFWLQHGFRFAIFVGYYNECAFVTGDAVDDCFEHAQRMQREGLVELFVQEFPNRGIVPQKMFSRFEWFKDSV